MNIFSKTFCRIYQSAFRIAMPLLPYRKPLIFTNVKECVPLFQKLNLNKILLVTDSFLRTSSVQVS